MKTTNNKAIISYGIKRSTYDPALDYLEGHVFFKEKMEQARALIKKHGLPERFMKKDNW
jgi:membrane protein DedA with SNARE-associated domain